MSPRLLTLLLYVVMAAGLLLLCGCATTTVPSQVLVPTPIPCRAAEELPDEPSRTLINLDASNPGATVQAYAANRARWMGYAAALRERLEACK